MTHKLNRFLSFFMVCTLTACLLATSAAAGNTDSPISHSQKSVSTSGGPISVNVLTVNTSSPRVTVKAAMVEDTIGATAPFSEIVESSGGAVAVINANFFAAYNDFKTPIGHVMVNGEFLCGNSGISSLGITESGEIRVGRPALFTRIKETSGGKSWAAYEINTKTQGRDLSVLYTPAYGPSVAITVRGKVMTVSGGKVTGYETVTAGTAASIPEDGYVVYMGDGFTSTNYFRKPTVGKTVKTEYILQKKDQEGFTLNGLTSVVSGAPRLVQDGAMVTDLEPGFTEARFTVNSAPRTAVGVDTAGQLVMVSTPSATIQQLREAMLSLGCEDAINLDGGASCGMYYNGSYLATPGRELTTTLQIFVES